MTFLSGFECGILVTILLGGFLAIRFRKAFAWFFNRITERPKLPAVHRGNVQAISEFSPVQKDVVEALVAQGMGRSAAEETVRACGPSHVLMINGRVLGGRQWEFDSLFRAAFALRQKKAAGAR